MPCIVTNVISDACAQTTGAQANIPFVSDSFAHVKGFIHMPLHSKSMHIKKKKKRMKEEAETLGLWFGSRL